MKSTLKRAKPRLKSFFGEIWPILAFIFLAAVVGLLFAPSEIPSPSASFSERLLIRLFQPVNIVIGISWFTFFLLSSVNMFRFFTSRLKKDPLFVQLIFKRSLKTCLIGFAAILIMWIVVNIDLLLPQKEIHRFPEGAVYEAN